MCKVRKAASIRGTRFLHIYATCPTGWKAPSETSVWLARLAVRTRIFPLYEVEDGERFTITMEPDLCGVDEYCKAQGRFNHLGPEDLKRIQEDVD
jgi:pyruvate/2-oxoacid:ferredoxin oxidoreductase beta subunit